MIKYISIKKQTEDLIEYYYNGDWHREDGPAREFISGYKSWWYLGQRHRTDGPAVEYVSGIKEYYYYNKHVEASSDEEYLRKIKLLAFL